MERILDEGFKQPVGESVLIQSRSLRATDPAFAAVIEDVVATARDARRRSRTCARRSTPGTPARSPGADTLRSSSSRSAATPTTPWTRSARSSTAVDDAQQAIREFFIGEFGDASAVRRRSTTAYADDLGKAGQLSLPITLAILVIAFGALVAAGIPLLLALTAVFATLGLVALSESRPARWRTRPPRSCF